ncbi:alpha/beta hydrolase [uncultured Limosilactobacillus sp.]|uniref:alpha/beta hydrolase n=1 Tax=uncultured Limosilactobacillus sp. TaxID=2837629 RepID=UPI0025E48F0B|nr:alpha/beta hydrolase [uncultured Limosilactobacillus sp.]
MWLIIALAIAIVAGWWMWRSQQARVYHPATHRGVIGTPTFFFHGFGSSAHAEQYMTDGAKAAGVTKTVILAKVGLDGHVTLHGTIPAGTKNPIIQVQYTNNRNGNYKQDGQWAGNVITAVQNRYRFTKMNLVGHSMGNMDIMYYLLANATNPRMPQLNKQVDIAGHFNGFDEGMKLKNNRRPVNMDRGFRPLLKLRTTYPTTARVLNIYGDHGGQTDGTVPNASSLSLKYLVANRAKSYQEVKMIGRQAQHSKLHHNAKVNRILIKFLWNK